MRTYLWAGAVLAAVVIFFSLPVAADGRRSWTYPEARDYFRSGGTLPLGMWDELHENPVDRVSITNLQLAWEVSRLRAPEPPAAGVIELLPAIAREVLLGGASLTVSEGFTDVVLYVYDSPVFVYVAGDGGKEDDGERLLPGDVVRVRGSNVRLENRDASRTATVTIEPLRGR